MKKRAILILSAMMATGMLFTGCSSSGNNQKTEKSEDGYYTKHKQIL